MTDIVIEFKRIKNHNNRFATYIRDLSPTFHTWYKDQDFYHHYKVPMKGTTDGWIFNNGWDVGDNYISVGTFYGKCWQTTTADKMPKWNKIREYFTSIGMTVQFIFKERL